jgi:hypothetical protein
MNSQITANCRCGAVQFRSQSSPVLQLFCHCKNCQESAGSPFVRIAFFKAKQSEVCGPLAVRAFEAESGNRTTREWCANCGSLMFDRSEGFPALIGVVAKRISVPFVFEPTCHVWTKSKQSYVTIPGDARQYTENATPSATQQCPAGDVRVRTRLRANNREERKMMKQSIMKGYLALALVMAAASAAVADFPIIPVRKCAADAVMAGTVCLDRYEASVWRVPDPTTTNAGLVRKIRLGRATRADLDAGGATQLGATVDYAPCAANGQNCANDIYAVSLPSEIPSGRITWFQAQEACANAGKRLPTNAEWQVGANGTPDPGPDNGTTDCNSATGSVSLTGARSSCVSARGAFDMVGNLAEWVADWVPLSTACPGWGGFSDDSMCLAGASETGTGPGALLRGGSFSFFFGSTTAGPLSVNGSFVPGGSSAFIGFRCVR